MFKKEDFKIQSIRKGISFAQIARELGVQRGSVATVLSGKGKSKRILDYAIARLGMLESSTRGGK